MIFRLALVVIGTTFSIAAQKIPDFTPPTPLFRAVLSNDASEVKRLLESGADPNEGRFLGATPVIVALMQRNREAALALMAKGANVQETDGMGSTTLMWAAATESGDASLVKKLLKRGVNVHASNKAGDTALSWAAKRGYSDVVQLLKQHGASDADQVRDAVQRSVNLLQASGVEFVKVSGCTSCHHQSVPQMTFALARERGIRVDQQIADKQAKSVIATFKPFRDQMLQGKEGIPDPAISVSYSLIGLGAEGYKPDDTTRAMAHLVATQQQPDGSFRCFAARPPMESSVISATALSLRALQLYGENSAGAVAKARGWLRNSSPQTSEEHAMKLLGLVWARADAGDLQAAARGLLAQQRPDGGWAQLPGLESDAYATGQALVALHAAGQITTGDAVYGRGSYFLLRTQLPDGSWHVRTRSFPFQPYKESGYPHGRDQWISATGASWAAMALSLSLPAPNPEISRVFSSIY